MARKRSGEEIGERLRQLLIQQEDLRGQLAALTERMSGEVSELEQERAPAEASEPRDTELDMEQIRDLLGHLAIAPTESDASEVIVSAARQLLPGTRGALCLLGEGEAMAVTAVWDAEDQWNRPYGGGAEDSPPRRLAKRVSAGPTGQAWTFPARGFGLLVGELRVWPEVEAAPELEGRCELLARSAGLVLAGMRLQRRLREQTVRDPMTSLLNRGYLDEALPRELHRATSPPGETGLIMLDIDRFSLFNDEHGPEMGDRMLAAIGELMRTQTPARGICCRYSGERFAILLPGTDPQELRALAESLGKAVEALRLETHDDRPTSTTISAGLALAPRDGHTAAELLTVAETGLFNARQSGGNTVGGRDGA